MNKNEAEVMLKAAKEVWAKRPGTRSTDQTLHAISILVGYRLQKNEHRGLSGAVNSMLNELLTIPTMRLRNGMSGRMNIDELLNSGREIYRVINDCN
jgi:hypothetical protein